MRQISWPCKDNLWKESELDFDVGTGYATKCTLEARAPTSFQRNEIEARANTNVTDMFCLPILWSLGSKTDELRRWSNSVPADVSDPLKSVIEHVLRDLTSMALVDHFGPSDSNHVMKGCGVNQDHGHTAKSTADFTGNQHLDLVLEQPVLRSAIHDLGIPKLCTDIVHLLIDDLLHILEEKAERYYRVWCRSGSAILVSSTTIRSFNAAGHLVKVSQHNSVEGNRRTIYT